MKKVVYISQEEMEKQKKKQKKAALIIIPITVVIFLLIVISSESGSEPEPITADDIKFEAKVMASAVIREQLKAPSTAKFSSADVFKKDSITYVVQSTVDAQNSFGAMIRMNYQVTLKYLGGNPRNTYSWQLIDSKLQ